MVHDKRLTEANSSHRKSHWRLVARQMLLFSFDLWFLLPLALISILISQLYFGHLPSPFRFILPCVVSLGISYLYISLLKPWVTQKLSPEVSGHFVMKHIRRSSINRLLNPTTRISPWILALLISYFWIRSLSFSGSFALGLFFVFSACFIGYNLCRRMNKLVIGESIYTDSAYSIRKIMGVFSLLLLFSISLGTGNLFFCSFVFSTAASLMILHVCISVNRLRVFEIPTKYFNPNLTTNRDDLFRSIRLLMRVSPNLSLYLFYIFKKIGFFRQEKHKEIKKFECTILCISNKHEELEKIAFNYNKNYSVNDSDNYSETIKNYELLSKMWLGDLDGAKNAADEAIKSNPENAYFLYTKARILWQMGGHYAAIQDIDTSLQMYYKQKQRHCLPAVNHMIYFLLNIAIERYFAEDMDGFDDYIGKAQQRFRDVEGYEDSLRSIELVHNHGNLLCLSGLAIVPDSVLKVQTKIDCYRVAAINFLWCLWNGSYIGSRLRIALLHAIGTEKYTQTISYLEWIEDRLKANKYNENLPFYRRISELRIKMEEAEQYRWMFNEKIVLYQYTGKDISPLEKINIKNDPAEKELAQEIRLRVFHKLSASKHVLQAHPLFSLQ